MNQIDQIFKNSLPYIYYGEHLKIERVIRHYLDNEIRDKYNFEVLKPEILDQVLKLHY